MTTRFRGIPALISVDRRVSKPIYQQIYDSFRVRVTNGELRAGELVPSTRELARELRVSRLPVLNAYAQLLAEGYFESRTGAGTFVASSLPGLAKSRTSTADFCVSSFAIDRRADETQKSSVLVRLFAKTGKKLATKEPAPVRHSK